MVFSETDIFSISNFFTASNGKYRSFTIHTIETEVNMRNIDTMSRVTELIFRIPYLSCKKRIAEESGESEMNRNCCSLQSFPAYYHNYPSIEIGYI